MYGSLLNEHEISVNRMTSVKKHHCASTVFPPTLTHIIAIVKLPNLPVSLKSFNTNKYARCILFIKYVQNSYTCIFYDI